jgi:hypothetical protein
MCAGVVRVAAHSTSLYDVLKTNHVTLLQSRMISIRRISCNARLRGLRLPEITTLDSRRLSTSDFLSLSGLTEHAVRHQTSSGPRVARFHYKRMATTYVRFPNAADGFFYFHPGPSYAPVAGELRFRIVESARPDDFNAGHDLLDIHGALPWSIPFPPLIQHKVYDAFASLIMRDYSSSFAPVMQQIEQKKLPNMTSDVNLIHSLGQPLYGDMSLRGTTYRIANGSMVGPSRVFHLLADRRKTLNGTQVGLPYTGA